MADEPIAAQATAAKPQHFGISSGLVDEHQPSRIKRTLLSYPAPACQRHVGYLLLGRPQAFL